MLTIHYSPDWRFNAHQAVEELVALPPDRRGLLIVPEQNSFDAEWALCSRGGDGICRRAEVLSFTRLATRVFSVTGGVAIPTLDKSGRLIAMAGALELLRPKLKLYGAHVAKPEFLEQLLRIVDEFHAYGLNAESVRAAREGLSAPLSAKLEELCLILELYDAVCAKAAQDPSTRLDRLREALWESDYAKDLHIVVEGFTDFTTQEEGVLEALAQRGAELSLYLCCDSLREGQSVFSTPRTTARRLRDLAHRGGLLCRDAALAPPRRNTPLAHMRRCLFAPGMTPWDPETDQILLCPAASVQEECELAIGRIQSLVRAGARWRDIGIAYSDAALYAPVLENLLSRYRLPAFFSGDRDLLGESVIRAVVFALEAASCGMEAEPVCEYLRSGYAPVTRDLADRLENYAFVWDLRGSRWSKPFDRDPEGPFQGVKSTEALESVLAPLNEAREQALAPLLELETGLREAPDTAAQVKALQRFLEAIGLERTLTQKAADLAAAGALQRAQALTQLYELLLSTMEQIYGVLGGGVRSPEDFFRFFRAALSQNSVGTIPATVDSLRVGQLSNLRNARLSHLVVLGASDGLLPSFQSPTGLLSDAERRSMKSVGLAVAADGEERVDRELLTAYTVLTAPEESLFVTCDREAPSYLFTRLGRLFPNRTGKALRPMPTQAPEAAALLAEAGRAAPEVLDRFPDLAAEARALLDRAAYDPGSLDRTAVTALYGPELRLSSSQVDRLAACKYSYFLQYGLRLRELKQAAVDPALYGTLVHYVLEHTVRQVEAEGGFAQVPRDRLLTLARSWYDAFVEAQLGGLEAWSHRGSYLLERNYREVEQVVLELARELSNSKFIPSYFEQVFRDETAIPITGNLAKGALMGVVDRVDLYTTASGKTYLRVVDYKTGRKDFDYTDILSGMGMQMLIYLFALTGEAARYYGRELEPAGVLYFPARYDVETAKGPLSPQEAEKQRRTNLRRKGLLLDDEEILQAMEPGEEPIFLPYRVVKKTGARSGSLADRDQLRLLEDHVRQTLGTLADRVWAGDIAPDPYWRGDDHNACRFCPYREVCRVDSGEVSRRRLRAIKQNEFWEALEKEANRRG